ncbi:MAG: hypothetical protein ABIX01_07960 [Chitinophagaceae bacterium]
MATPSGILNLYIGYDSNGLTDKKVKADWYSGGSEKTDTSLAQEK